MAQARQEWLGWLGSSELGSYCEPAAQLPGVYHVESRLRLLLYVRVKGTAMKYSSEK